MFKISGFTGTLIIDTRPTEIVESSIRDVLCSDVNAIFISDLLAIYNRFVLRCVGIPNQNPNKLYQF